MTAKKERTAWAKVRAISSWYFVIGLLIFGITTIVALRHNNLTALKLRDHVYQVDKGNGDVEAALRQLREYVYGHMNTNLSSGPNAIKPPIQLKYRYDRLVAAEKARVNAANAKVYTDAQNYCEQAVPQGLSGRGRVPCIQDYVTTHGVKEQAIPDALYKFDFASPIWSPDLAGWSLLLAAIFSLLLVVRLSLEYWLHRYLKN